MVAFISTATWTHLILTPLPHFSSVITALGILAFVLLKCMKKQKRRGRRFIHHIDSEQSSLSRNGGGGGGHYRFGWIEC